jgi:hypothetical protein
MQKIWLVKFQVNREKIKVKRTKVKHVTTARVKHSTTLHPYSVEVEKPWSAMWHIIQLTKQVTWHLYGTSGPIQKGHAASIVQLVDKWTNWRLPHSNITWLNDGLNYQKNM